MSRSGGNRGFSRGIREPRTKETANTIYVESQDCGKIIGKGGSRIRELQDSTEARIKVSRDDESDGTRKVEIWGSDAAVENATQRIRDLLDQGSCPPRNQHNSHDSYNNDNAWSDRRPQNSGYGRDRQQGHSGYRGGGGGGGENNYDNDEAWSDERSQNDAPRYENAGNSQYHRQGGSNNGCYDDGGCKDEGWSQKKAPDGTGAERGDSQYGQNQQQGYAGHNQGDNNGYNDSGWNEDWNDTTTQKANNDSWYPTDTAKSNTSIQNVAETYEDSGDRFRRDRQQPERWGSRGGRSDRHDSSWSDRRWQNDGDKSYKRGGDDRRYGGDRKQKGSGYKTNDEESSQKEEGPKEIIYVPADQVGRIIGRGGCNIKELQEESDCIIKVGKEEKEDGTIAVSLIGFAVCRNKVKYKLDKRGIPFEGTDQKEGIPMVNGEIDWDAVVVMQAEAKMEREAARLPIVKVFYKEEAHIRDMHPEEVKQFRLRNNNIMVNNPDCPETNIPNPVSTFKDCFRLYPEILEQIAEQGFTTPSPIQTQAWPVLMSGLDLIGIAQTGTGKTLAFLLPALIHIDGQTKPRRQRKGPTMLVMCPTRELALQIEEEVNKFSYKGIKSVCVYGGGSRRDQIRAVKSGVEIIVATPGRLNDLVREEIISLDDITYLVLDEADRMLDMGFEPDIRKNLMDIRPDRQTAMTSATWPQDVQELAKRYMNNPIHVQVGTMDLAAVHSVKQEVIFIEVEEKKPILFDYLMNMHPEDKIIVFVGKKTMVDIISSDLALEGFATQSIHGDRPQDDRISALDEFKRGEVRVLIATDVASRGLDVKDVTHVLNFDFPRNIEEYVHRIGRTGRAGRTGTALTFITRGDWRSAQNLIDIMAEADQEIPQELLDMAQRFKARQERDAAEGGSGGRDHRGRGRGRGGGRFGGGRRDRDDFDDFVF
ncbi:hypothetical protein ACOMHN_001701 [Nucella lapillus]